MRLILRLLGALLTASGLAGAVFTLVGLADPQQARLANGGGPGGALPSAGVYLAHLVVCAVFVALGLWLLLSRGKGLRKR